MWGSWAIRRHLICLSCELLGLLQVTSPGRRPGTDTPEEALCYGPNTGPLNRVLQAPQRLGVLRFRREELRDGVLESRVLLH